MRPGEPGPRQDQATSVRGSWSWVTVAGTALVALGILAVVFRLRMVGWLVPWVEEYLSPDQHIEPSTVAGITREIALVGLGLVASGLGLIAFGSIVPSGRRREALRHAVLADPVFQRLDMSRMTRVIFWVASLGGLSIAMLLLFRVRLGISHLYVEDGLFESASAILFFLAAILILRSVVALRRSARADSGARSLRWAQFFLVFLAIGVVFVAGEEISWGQRIFGWATPESIAALNAQNETNIHNFLLGDQIAAVYWGLMLLVPLHLWSVLLLDRRRLLSGILPHPSLALLAAMIVLSIPIWRELTEELLSLYALLHSVRLSSGLAWPPTAGSRQAVRT